MLKEIKIGGETLKLQINELATLSDVSILATMGETSVLVTVVMSQVDDSIDYFSLVIEYLEKFYASGSISGSRYVKREGMPRPEAILKARMMDRVIRPFFPDGFRNPVQIIANVLSYEEKYDPFLVAVNAVGVALSISNIPFNGPTGCFRVTRQSGDLAIDFSVMGADENTGEDHFNVVAGTDGVGISMVDADSYESSEADVSKAFQMIVDYGKSYVEQVVEMVKEIGEKKYAYPSYQASNELLTLLRNDYKQKVKDLLSIVSKKERNAEVVNFISELTKQLSGKFSKTEIMSAVEAFSKEIVKHMVLDDGKRLGGRAFDEIRQLTIKTGVLARTHGSALFQRGGTQALSIATLASMRSAQIIDGMEGDYTKRYMHHYNDYPFCYGENGRISYYPGRRAIGHGALAEKAVSFMLPSESDFPYAIRVVSEIMMSEGSTSMASTCGSSLALINAGVKLKRLVAGISVGLVAEENYSKYQLLLDIAEGEDFYGKMDFKVAGTTNGINAIQMDNKIGSIPVYVLIEALELAKKGRFFVLEKMQQVIDSEPQGASSYIPSIEKLKIPENKIGELIGPGGKNIKAITEETTADIDIQDDGTVYVFGDTKEQVKKALEMIDDLVGTVEIGEIFEGTVDKIMDFGAFVSLKGKTSGLVHKSQISNEFVDDPRKYVKEGQKVKVKVLNVDEQGKISLTMKNVN